MKHSKNQNAKSLSLIILLILFSLFIFICIKYIINNYFLKKNIESFDTNANFSNYNGLEKDPLFLSIKNAANISYLKGQIDELYKMKEQIHKLNIQEKENAQYNDLVKEDYKEQVNGIQNAINTSYDENQNSEKNEEVLEPIEELEV